MTTHDVLAFAIAAEAVRRIRTADAEWSHLFSADVYPTASRNWPMPDFVIVDEANHSTIAAEFKPPNQTRREYLTGLGQAIAYTRDFTYGLLVLPEIADDDYDIATHINAVLSQEIARLLPVGVLTYDPGRISPGDAEFIVLRPLQPRTGDFRTQVSLDNSFWAKWRDISPQELGLFLEYLYEEGRHPEREGTIRDRAFARLWTDMQRGLARHWGGEARQVAASLTNRTAWNKNYRNFVTHIEWIAPDGKLTNNGLAALHLVHQYGSESRIFTDHLAKTVLTTGKHLVLINAINEFQDSDAPVDDEAEWLNAIEEHLENEGLLKRNPERHQAAVRNSARGFLKAEKTLWKNLELVVPRGQTGGRVYHPNRGFIFDWARITSLLS